MSGSEQVRSRKCMGLEKVSREKTNTHEKVMSSFTPVASSLFSNSSLVAHLATG